MEDHHHPRALLTTPPFLAALLLLVVNDFWLKPLFGNAITGKLSDFAGLFVFPLFWTALIPRWRTGIHIATALGFVWWKSPYAQPLLDTWNAWSPLTLARTVDFTDLIALPAVGLAYWYSGRQTRTEGMLLLRWLVIPVSLFAFAATSFLTRHSYANRYSFAVPDTVLVRHLDSLGLTRTLGEPALIGDTLWLSVPADLCTGLNARLRVERDTGQTHLTLTSIAHGCRGRRGDSLTMLRIFEHCVVQRVDSSLGVDGRSDAPRRPPDEHDTGRTWRCTRDSSR